MAAFPTYARLLLGGYSDSSDYGVLRTEMDDGLAKQRARRSKPIVTRSATVMVQSLEDRLEFDNWMHEDLYGGAGWFDFRTLGGTVQPARIVGSRISWTSPGGGIWIGQVQIETVG
ncbi:hypothetical protein [Bordetella petrii]|uniref:hypothetical protein n=1 Tax=Bordetella petrii TaxID=94624 RepID=UPI00047C8BF9|nr:hypothetical protein [Bordetella petrii]